jgi:negative regulator of replication initiation
MMPTIRIDDDVWKYLQSKATPFEDTPNDVLRRVLRIPGNVATEGSTPHTRVQHQDADTKDYSGHRIRGYRLAGRYVACQFFKDLLVNLSNELRGSNQTSFDKVALALRGRKRSYFSKNPDDLKFPCELTGKDHLFVETNLNANLIVEICRSLIQGMGRNLDHFTIDSSQ